MARRVAIIQYDDHGRILQAVTTLLEGEGKALSERAHRAVNAMWLNDATAAHVFVAEHQYPSLVLRERTLA